MGRKTFESIGKPLKNRVNLVVTRNKDYTMDNVHMFDSIESAIGYYKENNAEQILYICGGSDIYNSCVAKADELNLSFVDTIANCDTFFPKVDFYKWQTIETVEYLADDKNEHNFTYKRMTRKI
jgi:dihydrofolate reductase